MDQRINGTLEMNMGKDYFEPTGKEGLDASSTRVLAKENIVEHYLLKSLSL